MKKRMLCLVLAGCLLLPATPALAAAEDVPEREKAAVLRELEIMEGDETGALRLESTVTRAEFTKMLVTASALKDSVGQSVATSPYPDVPYSRWYAPYIRAAVDGGLVQGDLLGYFHPDSTINLGEGVTMLVRLLGHPDEEFSAYRWPEGQLALARTAQLTAGVRAQNAKDSLSRGDCLHLFYNLLTAATKTGVPYIQTLGHVLNAQGEVDLNALFSVEREGPIPLTGDWAAQLPFPLDDALIFRDEKRAAAGDLREWDLLYWAKEQPILFAVSTGAMGQLSGAVEGPVVAEGDWAAQLPFAPEEAASVTRNGSRATWQDIREGDVVYWSKYTKSLTVYRRTVTGTVEAVSPSLAAPSAVVIAGQTYPLETLAAQYALSDLGPYRKGDAVTLLLGRGGGVAAVRPALADESRRMGVVSALSTRNYTDADGQPYAARTLTLVATDGQSYAYPWDGDDLEVGDLVQVGPDGRLSALPAATLTGAVDAAAQHLGSAVLSPDVEILDTYGKQGVLAVPPSRLAGVTLSAGMVRCWASNSRGEITHLILNNVTGDLHRYGILTEEEKVGFALNFQCIYTLDLGGYQQTIPFQGKQFPVQTGPVQIWSDGQSVEKLTQLTRLDNVSLGERTVSGGGRTLTLADNVACYIYHPGDKTYSHATRSQISGGGYQLSAWYDAPDAQGGRVRILVAQEIGL